MNNQQSQSPCIVLSQHRGDGERELKFEVKTEECVREIRPLGFVIEFWLESAVLDVSAVSSDMNQYDPSQRESARVCAASAQVVKKEKRKRKAGHGTDAQAVASLARHRVGRGCGSSGAASVLPSPPLTVAQVSKL